MKSPLNWNDRPEMLELVANALEEAVYSGDGNFSEVSSIYASEEEGSYGERGVVDIKMADGRRFRLSLSEIN